MPSASPRPRPVPPDADDVLAESAVVTAVLRALVEADLDAGADWEAVERHTGTLRSAVSDEAGALLSANLLIQQVLVEMACRPSIGRSRSEVISSISHVVRAAAAERRRSPDTDLLELARSCAKETFCFADVVLDAGRGTVRVAGHPIQLTPAELRMLHCLVVSHGQVVTTQDLHQAAWSGQPVRVDAVTTVMNSLRRKLGDDSKSQNLIRTAWGRGYRLAAIVHPKRDHRPPVHDGGSQPHPH